MIYYRQTIAILKKKEEEIQHTHSRNCGDLISRYLSSSDWDTGKLYNLRGYEVKQKEKKNKERERERKKSHTHKVDEEKGQEKLFQVLGQKPMLSVVVVCIYIPYRRIRKRERIEQTTPEIKGHARERAGRGAAYTPKPYNRRGMPRGPTAYYSLLSLSVLLSGSLIILLPFLRLRFTSWRSSVTIIRTWW